VSTSWIIPYLASQVYNGIVFGPPTAYKKSATTTDREIERLRLENAILHSGAHPPLEQDY
jgi:hypothetical protein